MKRRPHDSFQFRSTSATRRPPSGRGLPRRIIFLVIVLVILLIADIVWLHGVFTSDGKLDVGGRRGANARLELERQRLQQVDHELVDVLKKQKRAMEANPPVDKIQEYADRFKVLLVRFDSTGLCRASARTCGN